jgi:hypothetical protein
MTSLDDDINRLIVLISECGVIAAGVNDGITIQLAQARSSARTMNSANAETVRLHLLTALMDAESLGLDQRLVNPLRDAQQLAYRISTMLESY